MKSQLIVAILVLSSGHIVAWRQRSYKTPRKPAQSPILINKFQSIGQLPYTVTPTSICYQVHQHIRFTATNSHSHRWCQSVMVGAIRTLSWQQLRVHFKRSYRRGCRHRNRTERRKSTHSVQVVYNSITRILMDLLWKKQFNYILWYNKMPSFL